MLETPGAPLCVAVLENGPRTPEGVLLSRLRNHGFIVIGISAAVEFRLLLDQHIPDIVVISHDVADFESLDVVQWLRSAFPSMGVVMLTGRAAANERVRGLSQGVDAFLARPVDEAVLIATLHSLGRRLAPRRNGAVAQRWQLECDAWMLRCPGGIGATLTRNERAVLRCLFGTPGRLVHREHLIAALTPEVFDFDPHRLDSLISRLRRKILRATGVPLPLATVHGEGYVMTLPLNPPTPAGAEWHH